jgi:RNA polymerase primary sigma factor
MEETLKPMALEKFAAITELFNQFAKAQAARLDAMANGRFRHQREGRGRLSAAARGLTAEVESVQFHRRRSNIWSISSTATTAA